MKNNFTLTCLLCLFGLVQTSGQTILQAPAVIANGYFGGAVAIDNGRIISSDNVNFGTSIRHVYAYRKSGSDWVADGELVNPTQLASDSYGAWLAISGDYALGVPLGRPMKLAGPMSSSGQAMQPGTWKRRSPALTSWQGISSVMEWPFPAIRLW